MKSRNGIALPFVLVLVLVVPFAAAQKKSKRKTDLPAVFSNARYVYV